MDFLPLTEAYTDKVDDRLDDYGRVLHASTPIAFSFKKPA